jgi:hypothetical protein
MGTVPLGSPVHDPADDVDVVGVETLEVVLGVWGKVDQLLGGKHLQMRLEREKFEDLFSFNADLGLAY